MDPHYHVVIFGSARIREDDQKYQDVFTIAKGLAEAGLDVVTGGRPGDNAGGQCRPQEW